MVGIQYPPVNVILAWSLNAVIKKNTLEAPRLLRPRLVTEAERELPFPTIPTGLSLIETTQITGPFLSGRWGWDPRPSESEGDVTLTTRLR